MPIIIGFLLGGALLGLIPFFVGRANGRSDLGLWGLISSTISALLYTWLPLLVAIGFTIAILAVRNKPAAAKTVYVAAPSGQQIICTSGPLRGQTYRLSTAGITFGRSVGCQVRFPDATPGVSGRHCMLHWQNGSLMLTDLGSAYGTFLEDGRRLPAQYPMPVAPGDKFFVGSTNIVFQIQ